jgi:hypothetical protein
MATILEKLTVFIHPPARVSVHEMLAPNAAVEAAWIREIESASGERAHAVCVIAEGGGDPPLCAAAAKAFGERFVLNPSDAGAETLAEIARDFDRACVKRGVYGQVSVYELWSSANARRWSAGLRAELARRGLAIDPARTEMQTFGNWTGCHHKYTNFLATYLGFSRPARIRAEPEVCGNKGLPMKPARLARTAVLDHNVVLTVFERPDGCPMAQFWDGLRPVYEPPHVAEVELDPAGISLYAFPSNSSVPVQSGSAFTARGFVMDVGDGAQPAYGTVVGEVVGKSGHVPLERFAEAMLHAAIQPREHARPIYYSVEI